MSRKTVFFILGGIFLALLLIGAGCWIGWAVSEHQEESNPYQILKGYEGRRHAFIVKSAELSVKMVNKAIDDLRNKNIPQAVEDCHIAIDLFPIDAKPYILLTKLYLMTGQEKKMFETLTLAGRSYPNFDNILAVIDDENLDKLPLEEPQEDVVLANFPENKKSAVSFMFDDGEADVYKALPAFDKYGYKATIPVVAGYVAETSNDPFWGSWAQWKDAANRGFEIANHSMYHRDSKDLHGADFDVSIDQAQAEIEKNTGHPVTAYVFPHDSYTPEAVERALKGHEVVRTKEFLQDYYPRAVEIVLGGPHVSLETANRLADIGIKRHLWLVYKCHGVTAKRSMRSFKSMTPDFLAAHLAYLHSKDNDVWVETFSHIFEYLSRRKHTDIEIKEHTQTHLDFVLHNQAAPNPLPIPMTVVVKGAYKTATESGHTLKTWACETAAICVDVTSYGQNVHLE